MTDPALDAAQALTPLLAAGVDGVIAEVTHQAGASAAALVRRVVARLRDSLSSDAAGETEVAGTLRDLVADGHFSESELTELARLLQPLQLNSGVQVKGNAYINNTISIDGGGSFHG